MSGDLAQDVQGDSGVCEPREPGVAKVVSSKVFEAELGDDVVSVGRVAQDGCGDASAARAEEEPGVGAVSGREQALGDHRSRFFMFALL
ncbi:hypothetical protein [Streptomyces sp. NPDC093795]|uniref:hypothetical protein n=1 Tax=Streptomyces sp. NPDC093795 TaxID=3366051 RepID=UPI0037F24A5E